MSAALGVDLRERVIAAWERGEGTQKQVAQRFGVGVASVVRWAALKRETGSLQPRPKPGRPPTLTSDDRVMLRQFVDEQGDRTREDLAHPRVGGSRWPCGEPRDDRTGARSGRLDPKKKRPERLSEIPSGYKHFAPTTRTGSSSSSSTGWSSSTNPVRRSR